MCSPSVVPLAVRTCMRELYSIWYGGLGGVGSIHECYLHASTVCGPLEQCLAWLARAMYISFSCLYSYFACTHTVLVLVRCLYHCTVCTVLVPLVQCSGMADAGNAPTYPRLSSYCACIIAQCVLCLHPLYSGLAWPARAMYLFSPCLYSYCGCTIAQVLVPLVQCSGMASTGNVSILPVFVLVLCEYHCTVCTVLVPLVQCSGMASTGNAPTYPRLCSYCACTIAQCVLCLYPLYSGLAWPARAMYLFSPCLNSYCGCTIAQCVLCLYLLYSVPAWPARVMYLSYPCLYSYCDCTIAQCVQCLHPLRSVLVWATRAMYVSSCLESHAVLVALLIPT